jgi:hypothetical protein
MMPDQGSRSKFGSKKSMANQDLQVLGAGKWGMHQKTASPMLASARCRVSCVLRGVMPPSVARRVH